MRSFLVAASAALCLAAGAANAADLNLCTGGKKGNYFASGGYIGEQLRGTNVKLTIVSTKGSMDNLQRMSKGECDAAIVQSDAYGVYLSEGGSAMDLERASYLYDEYAHLVCNRNSDIGDVGSLESHPDRYTIMIGSRGSGTAVTWKSWTLLDEDYAKVPTLPISGTRAVSKAIDGTEAQCFLYVSGLNSGFMSKVDEQGKYLKLVPIDDGDFNDAKDATGKRIYEFKDIPGNTYDNLQDGFLSSSVETLAVGAILVARVDWIEENSDEYDLFLDAVNDARPFILKRVGQE